MSVSFVTEQRQCNLSLDFVTDRHYSTIVQSKCFVAYDLYLNVSTRVHTVIKTINLIITFQYTKE